MPLSVASREKTLLSVAIAAAILIQVSIAGSQILLGVGVALILIFRKQLPFPRVWIPLVCLLLWTILADALSTDPWGGRYQIRKFFVFLLIPLLFGVFRIQFEKVNWLVAGWIAAATASGLWGLVQFGWKYHVAHATGKNFYVTYLAFRITGFESHWMTFGALQLATLSLLLAHAFFSKRRFPIWLYAFSGTVLALAILLGWTRSIWLATVPAVLYLLWFWRPKWMLAVPVLVVLVFIVSPHATRERMTSLISPHGDTDSNRHRIVTFRTGVEMIKAHPWFGLGPEEIGRNFNQYVPADIRRPLPPGYYGHLHNIYVQYAAERGLPGLLCVLWFVGLALWDFSRGILKLSGQPSLQVAILHGAIAVTIGILVGGIFEYNLGDSEVLMMFVSVVAIGYAALESSAVRVVETLAVDRGHLGADRAKVGG